MRHLNGISWAFALIALSCVLTSPVRAESANQGIFDTRGSAACLKCHDDPKVSPIMKSTHEVKADSRTPAAQHDCESCHGPSSNHTNGHPSPTDDASRPAIVFKGPHASPVEERNKICLSCHEGNTRMAWQGSQHEANNVACTDCHIAHVAKDPILLKKSQPEKCFACHGEQRGQSYQFSHHPVREGNLACSDCHKSHGAPGPKLLKEFTVSETCYNCHADKRGPYLWEHQPVREDCLSCHTAHGSNQRRLLREREPYLCINCHNNSGHNSAPYSAGNLPGTASDARAVSSRMLARGCVNCHSQIHGSNSPAGNALTR